MSILKAACIGIAGTFLALQFQNTRKEYGIYLGIAVSIFLSVSYTHLTLPTTPYV